MFASTHHREPKLAGPWWPLMMLLFVLAFYQFTTVLLHVLSCNEATTTTTSSAIINDQTPLQVVYVQQHDPCSIEYWEQELSKEDPRLVNFQPEDLGLLHVTFAIDGDRNGHAKDVRKLKDRVFNRTVEMETSVACFNKSLPWLDYQHVDLGDFSSFHDGIAGFHTWAANNSPYSANIVIDTDMIANPKSGKNQTIPSQIMTWIFENVDMAISYDSDRRLSNFEDQFYVHSAMFGYRNNKRMKLFHTCVAHTMKMAERLGFMLRQQAAMAKVLRSPVGQFIRIRWLPPEFFCSIRKEPLKVAVIDKKFLLQKRTQCMFVHSHDLASQGREMLPECFD